MRDENTGLEPFVGLICSTFDPGAASVVESYQKWFHCRAYDGEGTLPRVLQIPFEIQATIRNYLPSVLPQKRFLEDNAHALAIISLLETKQYKSLEELNTATPTAVSDVANAEVSAEVVGKPKKGRKPSGMPKKATSTAKNTPNVPTLLGYLSGDNPCEKLARALAGGAAPILRCAVLSIITTGILSILECNRKFLSYVCRVLLFAESQPCGAASQVERARYQAR